MHIALGVKAMPYEDTRTWNALRDAIEQLEQRGALQLQCSERLILSVLCGALDGAGVFSLGEGMVAVRR